MIPFDPAHPRAEAERIANEVFRPTPDEIDELAALLVEVKRLKANASASLEELEAKAIDMVQKWGTVPPHAEKSRRLVGRFGEFTVTKADTLTVVDERVETLRDALEANGFGAYFARLFTLRMKYEVVEGAEAALKAESLPKRLSEKVLNLFGRCISVKPKKPSLKVTIIDPAKPAKKAKKAAAK